MRILFSSHPFHPITLLLALCLLAAPACSPIVFAAPAIETVTPTVVTPETPTSTPTLTQTIPPPPTATPTLPAPSATPEPSPSPTLPAEYRIRGITGHRQYFPIGCEAATAKDWANYYGIDFSEFDFQYQLPISDNPEYGFVGSVEAPWGQVPPYGYGVYNWPVANLLNDYGLPARAYQDYTLEQVKADIAQDKPVIAWVIGNMVDSVPVEYTDSQGRTVLVAAYEHVVILYGYTRNNVRYLNNGKIYEVPNHVFLNSWEVLGNRVIVAE